jgi:uncharacterized protein YydD (DUF2326 family)
MKLRTLSASENSFRTIRFKERGVSLILGDGEHVGNRQEGDSNGVGKTLALKLIHHCLGASGSPPGLSEAAADWWFYLDVTINDREHRLGRTGDGSTISLDESEIKLVTLRNWLNENGGFGQNSYSFRSLFPRFARRTADDCINPMQVSKEQPHDALQRTLYLLNLDDTLARRKAELKDQLDKLKAEAKLFKRSSLFREIMKAGQRPETRAKELVVEISRLRKNLDNFEVSADYREVEAEANSLTAELRAATEDVAIRKFELDGVREAQTRKVDITKEELLSLFDGLQQVFKPEVLKRIDEVQAFHATLITNRQQRLARDENQISEEIRALESRSYSLSVRRSVLLQQLHGKRALDEYVSMSLKLASLEEERSRLQAFVDGEQDVDRKVQIIRSALVYQDVAALKYSQAGPLDQLDELYREMVQKLYPDASAGVAIRNNTRENKLRFDLDVFVQGQDSDGIGDARVLCFDWLVFRHGRPHDMDFMWHDNRLFADLDPKPRASWFSSVFDEFGNGDHQYIASLNSENYTSMLSLLPEEKQKMIKESVVITLRGDKDSNRLTGVRFG